MPTYSINAQSKYLHGPSCPCDYDAQLRAYKARNPQPVPPQQTTPIDTSVEGCLQAAADRSLAALEATLKAQADAQRVEPGQESLTQHTAGCLCPRCETLRIRDNHGCTTDRTLDAEIQNLRANRGIGRPISEQHDELARNRRKAAEKFARLGSQREKESTLCR